VAGLTRHNATEIGEGEIHMMPTGKGTMTFDRASIVIEWKQAQR
jgi:hypothetical protein